MHRVAGLMLILIAVVGCKSLRFGPYTSPRIMGRVLAADTHQPLAGVRITRDHASRSPATGGQPKGGELLLEKPPIRTDGGGKFNFSSERALTIFRPAGWQFVQLSFELGGYEGFQTNLSILTAGTNSPEGEPLVETGDIFLRPSK